MYRVDGGGLGWFIVDAGTKKAAYSEGVREFGRGNVQTVEVATADDVEYFQGVKGKDATRPSQ